MKVTPKLVLGDRGLWMDEETARMYCPHCGAVNLHLDEIELIGSHGQFVRVSAPKEDSADAPAVIRGVYEPSPFYTRRQVAILRGSCEEGCERLELSFNQHKGDTMVVLDVSRNPYYEIAQ